MARILIRIPNWLGDAVMASGAIARFAHDRSGDEITLAGPVSTLPVFENAPYQPQLLTLERRASRSLRGILEARSALRRERFDESYLLTNSFSSACIPFMAGIPLRKGYALHGRSWLLTEAVSPDDAPIHQAAQYAYLFDPTWREPLLTEIYLTPDEQAWARQALREWGLADSPLMGFAIGAAYGGAKCWPMPRYAELARRCIDAHGIKALFFGAAIDEPLCAEAAEWAGQGAVSLAGRTTLRQLFALLRECRALVCNDSGVMHAAAALGTPLVAVFGPTDPSATAPLGSGVQIVRKPIECSPCLQRECPLKHHRCMKDISVDEVYTFVGPLLSA